MNKWIARHPLPPSGFDPLRPVNQSSHTGPCWYLDTRRPRHGETFSDTAYASPRAPAVT